MYVKFVELSHDEDLSEELILKEDSVRRYCLSSNTDVEALIEVIKCSKHSKLEAVEIEHLKLYNSKNLSFSFDKAMRLSGLPNNLLVLTYPDEF